MPKKIIIVEDEKEIAEGIQARLKVEGYSTEIYNDGLTAIEKIKKYHPDLIILDIMLPKINGWDVCQLIKKDSKTKKIPIIMLTALSQIKDSEKAFECGANDYLTKPFDNERLISKIKKFI